MINLPKPSQLKAEQSQHQSKYIIDYLNELVSNLEKVLGSVESRANRTGDYVKDIAYGNNHLVIIFNSGNTKTIKINDE